MTQPQTEDLANEPPPHCTTIEAARRLGMAVRSVQLMVDRGDLDAWKTPGGHRRISEESLERWVAKRRAALGASSAGGTAQRPALGDERPAGRALGASAGAGLASSDGTTTRVLLIEDSVHFQHLVSLLISQRFEGVELHVADDGVVGLAMYGRLQPDLLIVDILLPGIDGATLITRLRSHEQFADSELIVLTSLAEAQREPYAFALNGVPVVHKPRLVTDLPPLIEKCLASRKRVKA